MKLNKTWKLNGSAFHCESLFVGKNKCGYYKRSLCANSNPDKEFQGLVFLPGDYKLIEGSRDFIKKRIESLILDWFEKSLNDVCFYE